VNKVDVTAPSIICPATQTVTLDASCNGTLGNYISLATANDACSPVTVTQSPAAGTPANGTGSVTVTLTARDAKQQYQQLLIHSEQSGCNSTIDHMSCNTNSNPGCKL
jgi:hypothetical protein